jgi:hyperosmotically inducible protein
MTLRNLIAVAGTALILGMLPACAGTGQKVGTAVDDTTITTKVKTALAADRDVSATRVHVETKQGEVRLSGNVKSQEERSRAEQIARNVNGVTTVNNELTVGATN